MKYVVTEPVNNCIDHISPRDFRFLFTNEVNVITRLAITREHLYQVPDGDSTYIQFKRTRSLAQGKHGCSEWDF